MAPRERRRGAGGVKVEWYNYGTRHDGAKAWQACVLSEGNLRVNLEVREYPNGIDAMVYAVFPLGIACNQRPVALPLARKQQIGGALAKLQEWCRRAWSDCLKSGEVRTLKAMSLPLHRISAGEREEAQNRFRIRIAEAEERAAPELEKRRNGVFPVKPAGGVN